MESNKKRVLVLADWFEPGFKAGGPIRSCVNFSRRLKDDLEIFVMTSDRDLGEAKPYDGVVCNEWVTFESTVKVFYAAPDYLSIRSIKRQIQFVKPDYVYLNSMFSKPFSIYPLILKRTGQISSKVVLAPRGMLKGSALKMKAHKKGIFLRLFRTLGLHKSVSFHCTDESESSDVQKHFGRVASKVLPNLPAVQQPLNTPSRKEQGHVRILFVGRIHPIKNLHFLLSTLRSVKARVELTVVAPIENMPYWIQCQNLIAELPENISIEVKGEVENKQIYRLMLDHHLLSLPTLGENFGHAILEALSAGRPVLISDQTPWKNLVDRKAGWDLRLHEEKFVEVIERVASMDKAELDEWCRGAWNFCHEYTEKSNIKDQYLKLFS